MAKNIVICLDGTGNEFDDNNSNVVKLFSTLVRAPDRQVLYYAPGVGTAGQMDWVPFWGRVVKRVNLFLGSAFGYGIMFNIANAYSFLMEHYEEGDKVFIFGFSRGAYTARAVCSLLHGFGLLDRGNQPLVPYVMALFKNVSRSNFKLAGEFKSIFGRICKPHFVGLWDTVSSVGWIYNPVKLPYTHKNEDIAVGRHALSIDERRAYFRQNQWGESSPGQDLKEVWFAGVHCDVGGSYPENESGLSKISLSWMIRDAEIAGLIVDSRKADETLGIAPGKEPANPLGMMHKSLHSWWWLGEIIPRRYWSFRSKPPEYRWKLPLAAPRFIAEDSLVHSSVLARKVSDSSAYNPSNLPKKFGVV